MSRLRGIRRAWNRETRGGFLYVLGGEGGYRWQWHLGFYLHGWRPGLILRSPSGWLYLAGPYWKHAGIKGFWSAAKWDERVSGVGGQG